MGTTVFPEDGIDKHLLFPGRWDLPRSPSPTPSLDGQGRLEVEASGLEVSFEMDSENGER